MADKHLHLVWDWNSGELTGLALPEDGGSSDFDNFRRNISLSGVKDGVNDTFTTPDKFKRSPVVEVVMRNGVTQQEGSGNDYTVSESGGVGTGYDTITLSIPPVSWEIVTIDYVKI